MPRTSICVRLLSVLLIGFASCAACAPSNPFRPTPPFTGSHIPIPPKQHSPWTPPQSSLPEPLVTATSFLFAHGMADPRGCEYREIEIGTGSCWTGDGGTTKTHGWVLPGRTGGKRFAVAWNGLTYPAVSVGKPADLRADLLALLRKDEDDRARQAKEHPDSPFRRYWGVYLEQQVVAYKQMTLLKVCLLLRLGQGELAGRYWDAWKVGMGDDRMGSHPTDLEDPFKTLATEWSWSLFDRAVNAHARSDDRLALPSLRMVASAWKPLEEEADRRGFKRQEYWDSARKGQMMPHFDFLEPVPELLADQQRRAKETPHKRPLDIGLSKFSSQPARVKALVGDLENVAARQWGQPGGVEFSWEPVVKALANEGDAAVGPLILCLETDTRLTRSVQFPRDFLRYRQVLSVAEAAHRALEGAIATGRLGQAADAQWLSTPDKRKAEAARIREFWRVYGKMPRTERWYSILSDDNAGPGRWLEVAGQIVSTRSAHAMEGEALRSRTNPSVSELLAKRVADLADRGEPGASRLSSLDESCRLALSFAKWDRKAALPTLAEQVKRCRAQMETNRDDLFNSIAYYVAGITDERILGGDEQGAGDYIAWLKMFTPKDSGFRTADCLEPIWRFPDNAALRAAAAGMFNDPASPWSNLIAAPTEVRLQSLVNSPLIGLPEFRQHVLAKLSDTTPAGTAKLTSINTLEITLVSGSRSSDSYRPSPTFPRVGTRYPIRVCDLYASCVSNLDGSPRFELYWPQERRDRVILECTAFLKRYGDAFRYTDRVPPQYAPSAWKAVLVLPRLDHPATPTDVQQGRAVFSLEGRGKARVKKLPSMPLLARWRMLKRFPYTYSSWDPETGNARYETVYEQNGLVWQAEQLLVSGKWVDYYGFVGQHGVWMVPGSELEFLKDK